MNDKGERRRGVQSVEIGLRVLSGVVAQGRASSLSVIAQSAALSPSQAHRYLASLSAAGMVRQDATSGLYDLDAGALRLGLAALARLDLFEIVDAAVAGYAARSGRTCLVAIWGDGGPTVVRWRAGSPPVVTSLAIGSVLPVLQSATGQVFYAFGDPQSVEPLARAQGGRGAGDVEARRAQVRATRLARLDGDLIPGLRVAGAPVFDLQGRLAVVVTAIASAAQDRTEDDLAERGLLDCCRSITETLGGVWPTGQDAQASPALIRSNSRRTGSAP